MSDGKRSASHSKPSKKKNKEEAEVRDRKTAREPEAHAEAHADDRPDDRYEDEEDFDKYAAADRGEAEDDAGGRHEEDDDDDYYADDDLDGEDRDADDDNARKDAPRIHPKLGDEYVLQCCFDAHERLFTAFSPEFPTLKATGTSRETAIKSLEAAVAKHLQSLKSSGKAAPDAIYSRTYPEKLEIAVSQGLFRKLDLLSRQERVALDKLIVEFISSGIERRAEKAGARAQGGHQSQHHGGGHQHRGGGQNHRGRDRRGGQNRHGHGHGGGNHRGGNHGNSGNNMPNGNRRQPGDGIERGDNFLEYVRNLEKSGGTHRRGWKK